MKILFSFALLLSVFTAGAQGTWKLDKGHSNVRFTVTHMVVSEMDGRFRQFDGTIVSSKPDFQDAKINFTVEVASIDTDSENRDAHLKGEDFFSADKYPQMKFTGTGLKKVQGNVYELTGNLTIRDVTLPTTWKVIYGGTAASSRGSKAGFRASTVINRHDYGLKWSRLTEAGGAAVGKEVTISLNLEFDLPKP